jgi:diguanylate cyclase (GGDEF)-like protein/PAS domain S-box-containing protein
MPAFQHPETYRSILESLPTGLCVVDLQKKIVLWSAGAERITGHLRHDVIGHGCTGEALLHCDHQDCEWCNEECPLSRTVKTSQPAEAFGFLHHKAGHEIPVYCRAVPVRNEHGSIIGALETFEEQQTVSAEGREQNLNLPGCVDEITSVASRIMIQSHLRETLGTFADVHVPFGILIVQLDGLEQFRASYGSDAASSLLRVVARSLESTLWRTDFVGRWNDDQFLVILTGCREEALHAVRERIRRMLASDAIEWWGEKRSLPVLVGQATVRPGDSIESLLERAQKTLATAAEGQGRAATAANASQPSRS